MTHRALVAAALASGVSKIVRPLCADDTLATARGLSALGLSVGTSPDDWVVEGLAGEVPGGGELSLEQSGTSLRFLLAVSALGSRPSVLDGAPRLGERPIDELVRALETLGARIDGPEGPPYLPVRAGGAPLRGGSLRLPGGTSSQFASALLLIGSRLPGGLDLRLEPPVVSLPYVELTADVLTAFGVRVSREADRRWRVEEGESTGRRYVVEGDHSSASYFLAAAAVVGGRVRVDGVIPGSNQPDARLSSILEQLGCGVRRGEDWIEVQGSGRIPAFDLDLSEAPDLVPTLAVLALFSDGACRVRRIAHLRHKESDRLAVLESNLGALGRHATTGDDFLAVDPPSGPLAAATIRTESDHRMAMAFAVAGLRLEGITVDDAECVAKSNPGFWDDFRRLEGG